SAEEDDPNDPAKARYWVPEGPNSRDSSTAPPGGGQYSLAVGSTGRRDWHQPMENLYPGVPLAIRFWGLGQHASSQNMGQGGAIFPPASTDGALQVSPTNEEPSNPQAFYQTTWNQFPPLRSP